jgi:hypothetical protein
MLHKIFAWFGVPTLWERTDAARYARARNALRELQAS